MLDPSIPLSVRPPVIASFADSQSQMLQNRRLQQEATEADLRLESAKQSANAQRAIDEAIRRGSMATPAAQAPAAAPAVATPPTGPAGVGAAVAGVSQRLGALSDLPASPATTTPTSGLAALGQVQPPGQAPAGPQGGAFDPEAIAADLMQRGQGRAAMAFMAQVTEQRKKMADLASAKLEEAGKTLDLAARLAQGATPATWPQVRAQIGQLLGPQFEQLLPVAYDAAEIQHIVSMGLSAKDHLAAQHTAITHAQAAIQLMQEGVTGAVPGAPAGVSVTPKPEALAHFQKAAAGALGLAADDQQWQTARANLKQLGVPPQVIDAFGPTWTQQAQQAAQQAAGQAMTPYQQASLQGSAAARAETRRHNEAMERRPVPGTTGAQDKMDARALKARKASAEKWKQANLMAVERRFREGELDRTQLDAEKLRIQNSYLAQIGEEPEPDLGASWESRTPTGAAPPSVPAPPVTPPVAPSPATVAPVTPPAPTGGVRPEVAALLQGKAPGTYRLSDGSTWRVLRDGTIQPGQ